MNWEDRINQYVKKTGYPRSLFVTEDGRVVGTWIMGNNYQVKSTYYGGYPAGYLKRISTLFPDCYSVLHLFSGRTDSLEPIMCPECYGFGEDEDGVCDFCEGFREVDRHEERVDLNPELEPDYVDDAQTLEKVPLDTYDLVLADPPYSVEDCDHYQCSMVKRNKVMKALGQGLKPGAFVVWLDQVLPMYRKIDFSIEAVIGMVKSTNHRFRVVTIFRKK